MEETIYMSKWLRDTPSTTEVFSDLFSAITESGNVVKIIENSNDYWCRDYMPVCITGGKYVGYIYRPDYLWDHKTLHKFITEQENAVAGLSLSLKDRLDIIFDGGNYVRCGDKVIMTDKVFFENPNWKPTRLLEKMEQAFEAEIVVIPWDYGDKCGHADGIVSCLRDGRLLVNNYHQRSGKGIMTKSLFKVLERNFDIIELEYDLTKVDRSSWCYLNFLETSNSIILPGLSQDLNCDDDIAAKELFEKLSKKRVFQIYALPLIISGGVFHCVTWELYS